MRDGKSTYESVTHGIKVRVVPSFMEGESIPGEGRYFWAYAIEIVNLTPDTVQLLTRHWRITDGRGRQHEVRGEGVVGEQPVLRPGESFSYTSGCPLETPDGTMRGSYGMVTDDGRDFEIEIPLFPLDSPFVRKTLH